MRGSLMVGLLLLAGCGRAPWSDPASCRLSPGESAIAFAASQGPEQSVVFYRFDTTWSDVANALRADFDPRSLPQLRSGDRLTIIEDADRDPDRRVKVKVENGELAGKIGNMKRDAIRPSPH